MFVRKEVSQSRSLMQLINYLFVLISTEIKKAHRKRIESAYHTEVSCDPMANLTSAFLIFDRFDTIRLTYGYDVFIDRKSTLA